MTLQQTIEKGMEEFDDAFSRPLTQEMFDSFIHDEVLIGNKLSILEKSTVIKSFLSTYTLSLIEAMEEEVEGMKQKIEPYNSGDKNYGLWSTAEGFNIALTTLKDRLLEVKKTIK